MMEGEGRLVAFLVLASLAITGLVAAPPASAVTYLPEAVIELTGEQYVTVWGVAVGDADNDGRNELVANYDWYFGPSGTPRLVFFEWDGTRYREESAIEDVTLAWGSGWGDAPRPITLADADGDSDVDVTFAGTVAGVRGLYVYSWDGGQYGQIANVSGSFIDATVADVDGDGQPEIYASSDIEVGVYKWGPSGPALSASWFVSQQITFVSVADADGDPELEVVVALGDLNVEAYRWTGTTYVLQGAGSVGYGFISKGFGVGDLDSDGQPEVFRLDYWQNMVVYSWDGSQFAVEWSGTVDSPGDNIGHGTVGDADNDGTPEILVGHFNSVGGDSILVYEYVGGSYVIDWNSGWLPYYTHVLAVGDADNDGVSEIVQGSGAESRIHVFGAPGDARPFARASASPTSVVIGEPVTFDGSASTDDLGIASYLWEFGDGTTDPRAVATHAYGTRGTFTANLTVTDTGGHSDIDQVVLTVRNRPPLADAGPDHTSTKRMVATLDGTGSSDPDGDSLTFTWVQTDGPAVSLAGGETAAPTFSPDSTGSYGFALTVDDGHGGSASDTVVVHVVNRPPVVATSSPPGASVAISTGVRETFAVTATDPDGDMLTYAWKVDGQVVAAQGSSFEFEGRASGTYVVNVTVSDGEATVWREWTITVSDPARDPSLLDLWWLVAILVALLAAVLVVVVLRRRRRDGFVK